MKNLKKIISYMHVGDIDKAIVRDCVVLMPYMIKCKKNAEKAISILEREK